MTSGDVKPSEGAAEGAYILKRYLEYAETRGKASVTSVDGTPDSDFEIEVAERLRASGYTAEMQVIETLITRQVTDPDDWFHGVPQFQRTATDPIEKKRYFERICDIVARMMPLETARSAPQAEGTLCDIRRLANNSATRRTASRERLDASTKYASPQDRQLRPSRRYATRHCGTR